MNKTRITQVNLLLLIVVVLLTLLPQIVIPFIEQLLQVDIGALAKANETFKVILLFIDQYVLILFPVVLFVFLRKINVKEVFRLNPISISTAFMTVMMTFLVWFIGMFLTIIVYHIYSIFIGTPPQQLNGVLPGNVYWGFFLVALTPALCEEVLFRGVVLKAYERRGTVKAIVVTAILFAAMHFSIIRFVAPFLIGLMAGYVAIRSNSIIPAILTHFTFNGISMYLFYTFNQTPQQPAKLPGFAEYIALAIMAGFALLLLIMCIYLFRAVTKPETEESGKRGWPNEIFVGLRPEINYVYKASVGTLKQDMIAFITNWPLIMIVIIYIFVNFIEIVS